VLTGERQRLLGKGLRLLQAGRPANGLHPGGEDRAPESLPCPLP
jgi:hypothetical protein